MSTRPPTRSRPSGQATYALRDDTRITLGLRDTADYRETQGTQTLRLATPVVLAKTTQPGSTIASARTAKFSQPTFKLALDHNITSAALGYVSWSRGFKAGVFNTVTLNSDPVKPEVLDAFEAGVKSDWLDRRLRVNVSTYYYNYKNLQVQQFVNGFYTLNNAAKAEIKGVDFEVTALPVRGLTLQLSGTLLDPTYKAFPGGPGYTAVPITSVQPERRHGRLPSHAHRPDRQANDLRLQADDQLQHPIHLGPRARGHFTVRCRAISFQILLRSAERRGSARLHAGQRLAGLDLSQGRPGRQAVGQ
jgi:outer membrane receptor protein involved in Fe transport